MKNRQSGSAFVLILVILALAVASGIYLYSQSKNSQRSDVRETQIATSTQGAQFTSSTTTEETGMVHNSEHVYPEKIEIKGADIRSDLDREFTKVIIWPKLRNIENKNTRAAVNQVWNFKAVTDYDFDDLKQESGGITETDYAINYDKNNILSISIIVQFMGAYPSGHWFNYSFNLENGNLIKLSDIFYEDKIDGLITMLNTRQRLNMNAALRFARVNNPTGEIVGECSEEDIKYQFDPRNRSDSSYGLYKKDDIDFSITEKGIEFTYDFDFPHVIRACEPDQIGTITYQELKPYIRPDGLLGHEIR